MSNHWINEINRASKEERDWRKRAMQVNKRYVDRRKHDDGKTRFNILWSNTETMRPSLISATPRPECRPRYRKKDPIARVASKILERALEFSLDQYDFIKVGKRLVNDYLLPGRAVARVKYIPTFEKKEEKIPLKLVEEGGEAKFKSSKGKMYDDADMDEEGNFFQTEEMEEVVFEEVVTERVPWQWFRMQPADCWDDVNWVAFGAPYDEAEGVREFGKMFLQVMETPYQNTDGEASEVNKECRIVWELWDKRTRKRYWVAEGLEKPLREDDDPLGLEGFFPCPEPVYAILDNDSMTPTPEFTLWQDQADELDLLSERIRKLTDAIKAKGFYAGQEEKKLSLLMDADDNQLIPIAEWMQLIDKGGLDGLISWMPIEQFAKVLQILEQERSIKIQEIYELTGVSDILRGATDPRETAKAQAIKERSGNRRLVTKQDAIQRFFRDIYRIKAEIIAEQFDPETLRMMVGLENANNEIFQAAVQLIKSDVGRAFNVDIETDSTIAVDEEKEKLGLAEAMQAIGMFAGNIMPFVQTGDIPKEVAFEILRDYLRRFRFGRKLDESLEEFQQQKAQNPEDKKQQAEQQKASQEMQMKMAEMQAEMEAFKQKTQIELQALQQKAQIDMQKAQQKVQIDQEKHLQDRRQEEEAHDQSIRHEEEMHKVELENTEEKGEVEIDVKRKQAQINQRKVQE